MPFLGRFRDLVRPFAMLTAAALLGSLVEVVASTGMASPAAAAPAPVERVTDRPDRVSALAAARAQGSRVKVDGEGSAVAETFANPDGSLTSEAYAAPAFRRDGAKRDAGRWVPLSAALSGAGTSGHDRPVGRYLAGGGRAGW